MRISEENKKKIRAGYRKAAKPRAYITKMCEKYGLRRETVRKIIGLRTRDPMLEEAEGKLTVASWPYDEWAWGGTMRADAGGGAYGEALLTGGLPSSAAAAAPSPSGEGRKRRGRVFTIKPSGRPRVFGGEVERAILADLRQGMATKDVAARHGCSEDTVRRIRRRNVAAQQE